MPPITLKEARRGGIFPFQFAPGALAMAVNTPLCFPQSTRYKSTLELVLLLILLFVAIDYSIYPSTLPFRAPHPIVRWFSLVNMSPQFPLAGCYRPQHAIDSFKCTYGLFLLQQYLDMTMPGSITYKK